MPCMACVGAVAFHGVRQVGDDLVRGGRKPALWAHACVHLQEYCRHERRLVVARSAPGSPADPCHQNNTYTHMQAGSRRVYSAVCRENGSILLCMPIKAYQACMAAGRTAAFQRTVDFLHQLPQVRQSGGGGMYMRGTGERVARSVHFGIAHELHEFRRKMSSFRRACGQMHRSQLEKECRSASRAG